MGNFGVFPISLKPREIHVIDDALSRLPQPERIPKIENSEAVEMNLKLRDSYDVYGQDQLFGYIIVAIKQGLPRETKFSVKIENHFFIVWNWWEVPTLWRKYVCLEKGGFDNITRSAWFSHKWVILAFKNVVETRLFSMKSQIKRYKYICPRLSIMSTK